MDSSSVSKQSDSNLNEVDQRSDDNSSVISSANVGNVLKVKCKKHPKKNAEYISLVPDSENIRICIMCVKQDKIPVENYQDIKEILTGSNESDLCSYPVLTDSELNDNIQTIGESIDGEKEPIDEYFQQLSEMIEVIIERRKQVHKLKLIQFGTAYQRSIACRADIMEIEKLQSILFENDEVKLTEFIRNHVSNAENNTRKLETIYNEFQTLKNEFSEDKPNKIKKLVGDLLDEINFFNSTDSSPLHAIEESDGYRNAIQKKQKELEDSQSQTSQSQKTIQDMLLLIQELSGKNEQYSKEITNLQQENCSQKSEISSLRQQNTSQSSEISSLKQQNSRCNSDISVLRQQINGEKESNASLKRDLENLKKFLPSNHYVTQEATDLLPSTQLILSKCEYEYSQNLSIEKNQHNQLVFSNKTDSDYYGQAYLDFILNPTANYILQIKLEQEPGQDKRFWFGLMSDSDKEITWGWDDEKLSYFEYSGNYGLKTLVKGKSILDYDWSLGNRSLEVRINIQKRMLKVGSLPNYDSVVQADKPETINPATSYRFYFFLTNPRNKMTILKLQTVSQFDDAI